MTKSRDIAAGGPGADLDVALLAALEAKARAEHDGHFTVMRFTTNWRVGFGTPFDRDDIQQMAEGKSFAEAASKALAENTKAYVDPKVKGRT